MSRRERPKQFLDILGTGKTFLRATYERMLPLCDGVIVVTNIEYRDLVLEQLPELGAGDVLCEAVGRNTAPCIAYAAHHIAARHPDAAMIVTPADHVVLDAAAFRATVEKALDFVEGKDAMMTIGIKPNSPNTGYGYIQFDGGAIAPGEICKVKTFTEKPALEMARAFVASGEFLWNSGIFIFGVGSFNGAMREFLPEMAAQFDGLPEDYGQADVDLVYSECRAVSVDIGIMEKARNVYVCCGDFGWSDVGTWNALYDYAAKDAQGNAAPESALMSNSSGCLVRMPEGRVAVIEGLHDFIVVEQGNVLLVCPRAREQEVKRLVEELKFRNVEGVV